MDVIIRDDVVHVITSFLKDQLQAKLEPEQKKLDRAEPGSEQAAKAEKQIAVLKERFSKSVWMEDAALKKAAQLKFGSHISKGIHPDSKGDNVNFRPTHSLPDGIVGFQQILTPELDANGNAAALPLAAFFDCDVKGTKLRELILSEHPALECAFDHDAVTSKNYQQAFKKALAGDVGRPATNGFNKQLLWPMEKTIKADHYRCLIPLHPSALTNKVINTVNGKRFSEENKSARDNRKKKKIEQKAYVSTVALAAIQLGGTKPQNISWLTSKQRGRTLLLESLPPTYASQHDYSLSSRQDSFFNKSLVYHCYEGLQMLYRVVESPKNTVDVREQRKQALSLILGQVLQAAAYIQQHYTPGWSQSFQIRPQEKYWLDPERAELDGQGNFKQNRESGEWVDEIMVQFSAWLESRLKERFKKQSRLFDSAERKEWMREMNAAMKASIRADMGVFS